MPKYELRQRGKYWVIYWWDKRTDQPRRRSTGETDHGAAQTKLAQYIIEQPEQGLIAEPTILQVLLRYWEHRGQHSFARATVKRVMALLTEHAPHTLIYHWPIPAQHELAAKMAVHAGTRRRYMGVLRAALQWSFDRGEIPRMPAIAKHEAQDRAGVRPFSLPELQALFVAAEPQEHWRRLLLLCLCTGQRPGAVIALTWDRIDSAGVCDFDEPGRKRTKKRRSRVPLPPAAHAYLEERRGLGPVIQWQGRQLARARETMRRLCRDAKVKGSAYGLRKAAATWASARGVPEMHVKAMLGHSIGNQTERYAHARPEYMHALRAAQEALLRAVEPPWLAEYLARSPLTDAEMASMVHQRAANDG